jgi:hypothetical protein
MEEMWGPYAVFFGGKILARNIRERSRGIGIRRKSCPHPRYLALAALLLWWIAPLELPGFVGLNHQARGQTASLPSEGMRDPSWEDLFNGRDLTGWEIVEKYEYSEHGRVFVGDGCLHLEAGKPGTAIRWKKQFPTTNYELILEAKKTAGSDFFCGLTFPVKDQFLTLIVGGWGGSVVGLSLIDGEPAAENETCRWISFQPDRWYHIRLRVTESCIAVWLDNEQIIHFDPRGRRLSLRWESEPCAPFGVATWKTSATYRFIRLRLLNSEEISACRQ